MQPKFIRQVFHNTILFLAVFLVFILLFEESVAIPDILHYSGRFHPLILHFPIVLLILAVANSFTRQKHHLHFLLGIAVIFTLLTAILGFFLSSGGYEGGLLLTRHKWLGTALALLSGVWYGLEFIGRKNGWALRSLQATLLVLVVSASHYGAMITHGDDFLAFPGSKTEKLASLPDDPVIFQHLAQPVIEEKCISCHSENKSKGGLILSGFASLMKGGESGSVLTPGDPDRSEIMRRIHLPADHDDHMPPENKPQLNEAEIELLEEWIANGASPAVTLSQLDEQNPLAEIAGSFVLSGNKEIWSGLAPVSENLIDELATDYCTIERLAEGTDALSVVIFPHDGYSPELLSSLKPIAGNIVRLDLSYLSLGDKEIGFLSKCASIEWLELDFTPVDDALFSRLSVLEKLQTLKIHGTPLTEKSLDIIRQMNNLENLFVWDTGMEDEEVDILRSALPGIRINSGIDEEIEFVSVLPAPLVEPKKAFFIDPLKISLTHPLQDIDLLYTLDGSDPGSTSGTFKDEITIRESSVMKFMASKEGWVSSPVDSMRFFRTLRGPDSVSLQFSPDPEYPGKGAVLLFDLEKGSFNLKDSLWMGFRGKDFVVQGKWNRPVELSSVVISSFINTGIHVFPPQQIIVEGGKNPKDLKVIGRLEPAGLEYHQGSKFNFIQVPVEKIPLSYMVLKIKPLPGLPVWHDAKGKPAWLFIDEIVLED